MANSNVSFSIVSCSPGFELLNLESKKEKTDLSHLNVGHAAWRLSHAWPRWHRAADDVSYAFIDVSQVLLLFFNLQEICIIPSEKFIPLNRGQCGQGHSNLRRFRMQCCAQHPRVVNHRRLLNEAEGRC